MSASTVRERAAFFSATPATTTANFTNYGCTAYIDITDDHRSQGPKGSKRFKDTYKRRTEVERYFSRLGPREVEEMSQYKYRSIRNQMTIAHLALSLTAVAAALILKQLDKIRCYKTFADAA